MFNDSAAHYTGTGLPGSPVRSACTLPLQLRSNPSHAVHHPDNAPGSLIRVGSGLPLRSLLATIGNPVAPHRGKMALEFDVLGAGHFDLFRDPVLIDTSSVHSGSAKVCVTHTGTSILSATSAFAKRRAARET